MIEFVPEIFPPPFFLCFPTHIAFFMSIPLLILFQRKQSFSFCIRAVFIFTKTSTLQRKKEQFALQVMSEYCIVVLFVYCYSGHVRPQFT